MDIETILEMYEDDYNPGPRSMAQDGRIGLRAAHPEANLRAYHAPAAGVPPPIEAAAPSNHLYTSLSCRSLRDRSTHLPLISLTSRGALTVSTTRRSRAF